MDTNRLQVFSMGGSPLLDVHQYCAGAPDGQSGVAGELVPSAEERRLAASVAILAAWEQRLRDQEAELRDQEAELRARESLLQEREATERDIRCSRSFVL